MTHEKPWQTYEQVAKELLKRCHDSFDLTDVEGKQSVTGQRSKTEWEIDAKGIKDETGEFLIVECRRYTKKKLNQEHLGGLAWRIMDTGAGGGIIVSPLELQKGADMVAKAANIVHVRLNADATPEVFNMEFLNKIVMGQMDQVKVNIDEQVSISLYDCNGSLIHEKVIYGDLNQPSARPQDDLGSGYPEEQDRKT
jgi:hypothetical protein